MNECGWFCKRKFELRTAWCRPARAHVHKWCSVVAYNGLQEHSYNNNYMKGRSLRDANVAFLNVKVGMGLITSQANILKNKTYTCINKLRISLSAGRSLVKASARPWFCLVVDEDVKKPTKQTNYNRAWYADLQFIQILSESFRFFSLKFSEIQMTWLKIEIFPFEIGRDFYIKGLFW